MEGTAQQTGNAVPGTHRIAPGRLGTSTITILLLIDSFNYYFIYFLVCFILLIYFILSVFINFIIVLFDLN